MCSALLLFPTNIYFAFASTRALLGPLREVRRELAEGVEPELRGKLKRAARAAFLNVVCTAVSGATTNLFYITPMMIIGTSFGTCHVLVCGEGLLYVSIMLDSVANDLCVFQGGAEQLLLRRAIGRGQAGADTIMCHTDTPYDGVSHSVCIWHGVVERL